MSQFARQVTSSNNIKARVKEFRTTSLRRINQSHIPRTREYRSFTFFPLSEALPTSYSFSVSFYPPSVRVSPIIPLLSHHNGMDAASAGWEKKENGL